MQSNHKKKKSPLLKLLISISVLILVVFYNNPRVKEHLFYFIETNIFYKEIPPVYTDINFKKTEPNKICAIMVKEKLIPTSYSRHRYFDFSCETGILVSPKSEWSIQYLATGKIFNIDTVVLRMNVIKKQSQHDSAVEFLKYTEIFLNKIGGYSLPEIAKRNIMGMNSFDLKLDENLNIKYYIAENDIYLLIN